MDALFTLLSNLLDRHNCVVVPGLGGFVAEYRPAKLLGVQGKIMPPGKELAFNPRLIRQDGLMAGALAEQAGINYDSAEQRVNRFAEQCKAKLNETRNLRLPGLGKLLLEDQNLIRFVPDETTNHLEDAFGLPELITDPVSRSQAVAEKGIGEETVIATSPVAELAMDRWSPRAWGWMAAAVLLLVGAWQIMVVTDSLPTGLAGLLPGQPATIIQDGRAAVLYPLIPSLPRQMAAYGPTTALSDRGPSALLNADSSVQILEPQDDPLVRNAINSVPITRIPDSNDPTSSGSTPEPKETAGLTNDLDVSPLPDAADTDAILAPAPGVPSVKNASPIIRFAYGSGERPPTGYYVVVGSYPSEASAMRRLNQASKEHGVSAIMRAANGNYRAAFFVDASEMVVWQQLDSLRDAHSQSDAWILGYTSR